MTSRASSPREATAEPSPVPKIPRNDSCGMCASDSPTPSAAADAVPPAPSAAPTEDDEVAAVFRRFNTNGDGMLDMEEVRHMLDAAGYAADSEYVQGLADSFGRYDADGSGGIELAEFRQLWAQMDLSGLRAG